MAETFIMNPDWPPHGQSVDLNEYPSLLKGMMKCRSFKADLRHKLEIILRAHGGWGQRGVWRASSRLGVTRHTFRKWIRWKSSPRTRLMLELIDDVYEESIEKLAQEALREGKKRGKLELNQEVLAKYQSASN